MITKAQKWIQARIKERTTLDGALLILAGISFLIFKPIASIVAYEQLPTVHGLFGNLSNL